MNRKLPRLKLPEQTREPTERPDLQNGSIRVDLGNNKFIDVDSSNVVPVAQLGRGAYGEVERVIHTESQFEMAVKRIQAVNQDGKRLVMDRDVLEQTRESDSIVKYYGALFGEGDLWIFMEIMDTSLDKFYRKYYGMKTENSPIVTVEPFPEYVLGKIAVNVVSALDFLYKRHIIHRDVKPSNILINKEGKVKLCDFGISGYLVNSIAKTIDAGCKPYMAPERINPSKDHPGYDIRSDVWSFGITILEIAIGKFPYPLSQTFFDQLKRVCSDDPPKLPDDTTYSEEFQDFLVKCLNKNFRERPYYTELLKHKFIENNKEHDISEFVKKVLEKDLEEDSEVKKN